MADGGAIYGAGMNALAQTRRTRLIAYMLEHGMTQPDDTPSPTALANATGKRANYCNDLLRDAEKPFGEKVARSIEAALGMHDGYLDGAPEPAAESPAMIKRIHQKLSAGRGHPVYHDADQTLLAFQRQFLRKIGVSERSAAIFDISGRSMEPLLHDGAVGLINMNVDRSTLIDGKPYAFICADECMVKTLFKRADGTLLAHSENPDKETYPDFVIDGNGGFQLLGRVMWEGRVV